ncbi:MULTISPECIES: GlxA family transcriptional regulator [Acetobacteraceae]|uniref:Helix-turn-helix domain-containing protein n=1 Tax=Acetobacter conturbans TaxID=1737472 RepID=A0ABX0K731_9PROT|nr:GlxA family transcriptional regulator [Acetobacter conturbans]NHN90020.1 helix-turn-helix domain-containing protein [Acetobacter conturbans]
MPAPSDALAIWFVVFPGFELLDVSGPLCAFNLARDFHRTGYDIRIVSVSGGLVTSSSGVTIDTIQPPVPRRFDTLVVVGAPDTEMLSQQNDLIALVRMLAPHARRSASVCTGTFVLAAAGLLDGHRVTTHWRHTADLQRRYPSLKVEADRIFIHDGIVWTSAGITAGIDLALAMIEKDFGIENSKAVARELVVYHRRGGGQSQFSTLLDLEPRPGRIRDAIAYIHTHLREPLSVERLADVARISPRQFARQFVMEAGETPARAVERLRCDAALPRIENTSEPFEQIALHVGFRDLERMRRACLRVYGQPPQALRRRNRNRA